MKRGTKVQMWWGARGVVERRRGRRWVIWTDIGEVLALVGHFSVGW